MIFGMGQAYSRAPSSSTTKGSQTPTAKVSLSEDSQFIFIDIKNATRNNLRVGVRTDYLRAIIDEDDEDVSVYENNANKEDNVFIEENTPPSGGGASQGNVMTE